MNWFRILTSGPTIDGRDIKPEWISQMAASYDTGTYTARIWLEHLRGIIPDGPFRAWGDVSALMAKPVEDGKVGLFAQLVPHADLKAIIKAGQKVFTSAEIDPDFLKSGTAYLVGLGVTDSPASIGTERLTFSDTGLLGAKRPDGHIVLSTPLELIEAPAVTPPPASPGLFDQIKALFTKHQNTQDLTAFRADLEQALTLLATQIKDRDTALTTAYADLKAEHQALAARFAKLYDQIDNTRDDKPPAPALGGNGSTLLADY